jgi:hypothetical protein
MSTGDLLELATGAARFPDLAGGQRDLDVRGQQRPPKRVPISATSIAVAYPASCSPAIAWDTRSGISR